MSIVAGTFAITPIDGVLAQELTPVFDSRFSISVGAFVTDHTTNIRFDTDMGAGTTVNLEEDLGLDATTNVLRVDALWQFAERHRADIGVFDLSQHGSRNLEKDLLIGGVEFSLDESVTTDWKMRLVELGYSYRIRGNDRFQWWFDTALFIQDTAITVEESATGRIFSSSDVILPLPKLGTSIRYLLSDRWLAQAGIDVFKLEIDDVGGSLVDLRATLDYRFTDNISIGAGWHLIDVTVDLDRSVSGWQGQFDWQTRGIMLYGRLTW